MSVSFRLSVLYALFSIIGIAQNANTGIGTRETSSTAGLSAFERFASKAGVRVFWSAEVERITAGETTAVITALTLEDVTQTPRQMRGVRLDVKDNFRNDRIYVAETTIARLLNSMNDVAASYSSFFDRFPNNASKCFGTAEFRNEVIEDGGFFTVSQCFLNGEFGLSVHTRAGTFRFAGLDPLPFSAAITRGKHELSKRQ